MTRDLQNPLHRGNGNYDMEEWERWDENLVEDFGHWLTLVAKAFAVVILLCVLMGLGTWLWSWF